MPGLSVASHPFFLLLALLIFYIAYRIYRLANKRMAEAARREQNRNLITSSTQAFKSYGRRTGFKRLELLKRRQADFWTANKYFIVPKVWPHAVSLFLPPSLLLCSSLPASLSHKCRHALPTSFLRR